MTTRHLRLILLPTLLAAAFTLTSCAHRNDHDALANLPMNGGYPTAHTSQTLDDELYFQRATQAYLWALPAVNMDAMK